MKLAFALALVAIAGPVAHADPVRHAYVDEVGVYGAVDPGTARELTRRTLERAGYRVVAFAGADAPACGANPECLRRRGRDAGADLAVRLTLMRLAGRTSATITGVSIREGRRFHHAAEDIRTDTADEELALAVASWPVKGPGSDRRWAAWGFAGAGTALALAGTGALLYARAERDAFFDDHVADNGDVIGISLADARAEEDRVRHWQTAGAVLLGLGAASGVTATVLFVRDGGDERPRPAGLALGGRF